jgi:hypothetical protein
MHCHHCFAGTRSTKNTHGTTPVAFNQATLAGMQKDPPLLKGRSKHRFKNIIV